ncbi:MAG TPA: class I SAM-dependent methyltransferase [Ktedonobacterales bacterium]
MASLYGYGLKVGMLDMAHGRMKDSLKHLLIPMSYWRTAEYGFVFDEARFQPGDRVLDIGSPKLPSLFIAHHIHSTVYSTDIDSYFIPEYAALGKWEGLKDSEFHVEAQDGTQLTYPDSSFDKVYSVSVIEHIPGAGDSACLREIARVLKPGGSCYITVPFAHKYEDQMRPAQKVYWASHTEDDGDGMVFFQRRYSEAALHERLIAPSGLRVRRLAYIGEKLLPHDKRELFERLPFAVYVMLGLVQTPLAHLLLTPPTDDLKTLRKPLCACLVLEKPA